MKIIAFFLYFYMTLAISLSSLEGITEDKRNVGCAIGVVQSALETFSVSKDTLSKRALGHSETSFELEERSDACVMATGVALCAIGAGLCSKLC
ncbi:hypothetical protein OXX79_011103 [Metschnikowia pulcherrima]